MEYSHNVIVPQLVKQMPAFIYPEGSLPHSQDKPLDPAICSFNPFHTRTACVCDV